MRSLDTKHRKAALKAIKLAPVKYFLSTYILTLSNKCAHKQKYTCTCSGPTSVPGKHLAPYKPLAVSKPLVVHKTPHTSNHITWNFKIWLMSMK